MALGSLGQQPPPFRSGWAFSPGSWPSSFPKPAAEDALLGRGSSVCFPPRLPTKQVAPAPEQQQAREATRGRLFSQPPPPHLFPPCGAHCCAVIAREGEGRDGRGGGDAPA